MYPVYETDLSVRTEIRGVATFPEFPTAARISEFVAQLEELSGRMNSYGPTEPHLWLVGKNPPKTWEDCRQTPERKARTQSYDDLIDLLIRLAMDGENDSHMDHNLPKTRAEKSPGERLLQPNVNPCSGRGGQLINMK